MAKAHQVTAAKGARVPLATYRLQLGPALVFAGAERLLPSLARLGISDLYSSPVLAARPGSTHGYDVIDHSQVNPELGGAAGLVALSNALAERDMGLLVDVVPNHMCASPLNRWWMDVLENGRSSLYAAHFDVDWNPANPALAGRVLLPVLGDQYGRVLESGQLEVRYAAGAFTLQYHEHHWPLAPKSWAHLLEPAVSILKAGDAPPGLELLESVLTALRYLPPRTDAEPAKVRERVREKEIIKARLAELMESNAPVRQAVLAAVKQVNGEAGTPASFDRLDALLLDQAYRVAYWRVASDEINYRRFFDINELAALRVEEPRVFDAVHGVLFELVREGRVTGLRVDHVDGLFDPQGYLEAVQAACRPAGAPRSPLPLYLVVEKILAEGERLPPQWPVHGTTGYDFLNEVGGLFVDPAGAATLREAYARLGAEQPFTEVVYECKKLTLRWSLASQIFTLARSLAQISEQHRHSRDFTTQDLTDALIEVVACLSMYRTYLRPGDQRLGEADQQRVAQAVAEAARRNPVMPTSLFEFVRGVLCLDHPAGLGPAEQEERRGFVLKLQQLTGAVMAKAIEDTAFYRFYPLCSRGEVGGNPESPGVSVAAFHQANLERLATAPHGMLSTATHDTKRGEDLRARVRVLSEQPQAWAEALARFRDLNRAHCTALPEGVAPDANEQYLFFQTLVGLWPFEAPEAGVLAGLRDRLTAYMTKVLREAKVHSSWVNVNEPWERAVARYVEATLTGPSAGPFLAALQQFAGPISSAGVYGSLSQVLLKATSPGVPDFYQGTELWDFSLVDPDNRRPVDFELRARLLEGLELAGDEGRGELVRRLASAPGDGRLKLYVTQRALAARRAHRAAFEQGEYLPLAVSGPAAEHVVAFARKHEGAVVVVLAGRLLTALGPQPPLGTRWGQTRVTLPAELGAGSFRDCLSGQRCQLAGGTIALSEAFSHLPLALLEVQP